MITVPDSSFVPFYKLSNVTDDFQTGILHTNENNITQMDEHCIELINEKCSFRRPLESKELLQQYCYCWWACGTHERQEKFIHIFPGER